MRVLIYLTRFKSFSDTKFWGDDVDNFLGRLVFKHFPFLLFDAVSCSVSLLVLSLE